jgi:hypothetical protein
MNHEKLLDDMQERLGGRAALIAHVNTHREKGPPPEKVTLLMDYRPEGGIVIGGFEDGHWWNLDNGDRFGARPYAWCPLPFPES